MIPDEAVKAHCPIAYDHTDAIDECRVCGWGAHEAAVPASGPRDMSTMTGPERIREAIKRLNGGYAPTRPIMFDCGGEER